MITLTAEQRKQLKILAYQIKGYGGNQGNVSLYFYDSGDFDMNNTVYIEGTPHTIRFDEDIDELFREIFERKISSTLNYDESGTVDYIIDAEDSTLEIVLNINRMKTYDHYDEYTFDELRERIPENVELLNEFFNKGKSSCGIGNIDYNGSGDSGYIEDTMYCSRNDSSTISMNDYQPIIDLLYGLLSNYGGWEINEGSQGSFNFDFESETMAHEHGENYEESESDTYDNIEF